MEFWMGGAALVNFSCTGIWGMLGRASDCAISLVTCGVS
ncbi:hypothetical protein DB30_05826 [Enhygromyxa salina]|uniref:Uncharacterized protein n=1 Tax=Enhygromyxa salina TaxID=215803 RepID=A0A0C2D5H6_9BACT|nr:hypothetical protein DB30_05826 [Enhygromyxa salina]